MWWSSLWPFGGPALPPRARLPAKPYIHLASLVSRTPETFQDRSIIVKCRAEPHKRLADQDCRVQARESRILYAESIPRRYKHYHKWAYMCIHADDGWRGTTLDASEILCVCVRKCDDDCYRFLFGGSRFGGRPKMFSFFFFIEMGFLVDISCARRGFWVAKFFEFDRRLNNKYQMTPKIWLWHFLCNKYI